MPLNIETSPCFHICIYTFARTSPPEKLSLRPTTSVGRGPLTISGVTSSVGQDSRTTFHIPPPLASSQRGGKGTIFSAGGSTVIWTVAMARLG